MTTIQIHDYETIVILLLQSSVKVDDRICTVQEGLELLMNNTVVVAASNIYQLLEAKSTVWVQWIIGRSVDGLVSLYHNYAVVFAYLVNTELQPLYCI